MTSIYFYYEDTSESQWTVTLRLWDDVYGFKMLSFGTICYIAINNKFAEVSKNLILQPNILACRRKNNYVPILSSLSKVGNILNRMLNIRIHEGLKSSPKSEMWILY